MPPAESDCDASVISTLLRARFRFLKKRSSPDALSSSRAHAREPASAVSRPTANTTSSRGIQARASPLRLGALREGRATACGSFWVLGPPKMDFPRNTVEISAAVKARQKPVDSAVSLEAYFTTADHVGFQARRPPSRAPSRRVRPESSRPPPPCFGNCRDGTPLSFPSPSPSLLFPSPPVAHPCLWGFAFGVCP
jgi:hypothetical protein